MALVALGLALVILHPQLLRGVYSGLVTNDAVEPAAYAVVVNGDRESFDCAARLLEDGRALAILVLERKPPRTVQSGAAPSFASIAREELVSRRCAEASVQVLSTQAMTNWQLARELDGFLRARAPAAHVTIICPEMQSRYYRSVMDAAVGPVRGKHLHVMGFAVRGVHAGDWWRHRLAVAKVGIAYLRLAHVLFYGEGFFNDPSWSPEGYEEALGSERKVVS